MTPTLDVILKRFEQPDEVRTFEKGKFELVRIGGMTIGRAATIGLAGWKWSLHVRQRGWSSPGVLRLRWRMSELTNCVLRNSAFRRSKNLDVGDSFPRFLARNTTRLQ